MAKLLLGKPVAEALSERLRLRAEALRGRGIVPKLAIVRCGENPSDLSYERGAIGPGGAWWAWRTQVVALPEDVAKDALIERHPRPERGRLRPRRAAVPAPAEAHARL